MDSKDTLDHVFDSDASVGTVESESAVLNKLSEVDFPFLKGVAISMWQNSGDKDSNWTRFINERRFCGMCSTVADGTTDKFPDTWNRYKEDIALIKEMNCNALRLSLEWARIEPVQGEIDYDAIARYNEIFDCLEKNDVSSSVTLHHFVHPGWFQDLGGFEKEENIPLFVNFAIQAFKLFHTRSIYWATFNEPTVYTFCSYLAGQHAPGTAFAFGLGGKVLLNIMKAHSEVYKALKALDCGKDCLVGIVHHNIWFSPSGKSILYSLSRYASYWMTYWWGRDLVLNYFRNGTFKWKIPFYGKAIEYSYPEGRPPCDWWGINYYSRLKASWILRIKRDEEVMTDMNYPIHPQGLYRTIKASSTLNLPMLITETGVADGVDDRRHLMIRSYTNELIRAIRHGFDVRGMFYWTLVDNFEWNMGYKPRFGLYEFSPEKGIDRKLRENAKELQTIYKTWPDNLMELYKFARGSSIPAFEEAKVTLASVQNGGKEAESSGSHVHVD